MSVGGLVSAGHDMAHNWVLSPGGHAYARGTNRTKGIRSPTARKSASEPSTVEPITRGRSRFAAARCLGAYLVKISAPSSAGSGTPVTGYWFRLRDLTAVVRDARPQLRPASLSAAQSGEHPWSLLTNEITGYVRLPTWIVTSGVWRTLRYHAASGPPPQSPLVEIKRQPEQQPGHSRWRCHPIDDLHECAPS